MCGFDVFACGHLGHTCVHLCAYVDMSEVRMRTCDVRMRTLGMSACVYLRQLCEVRHVFFECSHAYFQHVRMRAFATTMCSCHYHMRTYFKVRMRTFEVHMCVLNCQHVCFWRKYVNFGMCCLSCNYVSFLYLPHTHFYCNYAMSKCVIL